MTVYSSRSRSPTAPNTMGPKAGRRVHAMSRPALGGAAPVPLGGGFHHRVHPPQRVRGRRLRGPDRSERGHDAVAHELVDGPAVGLEGRNERLLIVGQHRDHLTWRDGLRGPGKPADVAEHDGGVPRLSAPASRPPARRR